MKKCYKCKNDKDLSEFSKCCSSKDGLQSACKPCHRMNVKMSNADNPRYREYQKQYQKRPEVRSYASEYHKNHSPIKKSARSIANHAVRDGILIKKPCLICNTFPADMHHEDYHKPLEVVWLCHAHHQQLHASRFSLIPTN